MTQYFSNATRELLQRAAQTALEWGSLDLDTDHLLFGALQDNVVRHVLDQADADPDAIAAQLEEEAEKAEQTDVSPSLSPDAKATLIAAYEESRELGASYVGPEHVLLALARDEESPAGQLLQRFGLSHTKLRGAVIRGVEAGTPREHRTHRRSTSSAPTSPQHAREGKLDPVIGRADEIEQTIEILSPPHEEQPGPGRRARRRQDGDRRGTRPADRRRRCARAAARQARGRARSAGMLAGTKYRGDFEERLKT